VTATDTTPEAGDSSKHELIAAIILGLAATLTALAAYFGSMAGGDAANLRTDSGRTLADANFFYARETQTLAADQELFVAVIAARTEGNVDLEAALIDLMSLRLEEAIAWWDEQDHEAVLSPFQQEEGNPYYAEDPESDIAQAEALQADADAQVLEADEKDEQADKFDLSTVLLALTLFFAGVATLFDKKSVVQGMLGVGVITLVAGTTIFLTGL